MLRRLPQPARLSGGHRFASFGVGGPSLQSRNGRWISFAPSASWSLSFGSADRRDQLDVVDLESTLQKKSWSADLWPWSFYRHWMLGSEADRLVRRIPPKSPLSPRVQTIKRMSRKRRWSGVSVLMAILLSAFAVVWTSGSRAAFARHVASAQDPRTPVKELEALRGRFVDFQLTGRILRFTVTDEMIAKEIESIDEALEERFGRPLESWDEGTPIPSDLYEAARTYISSRPNGRRSAGALQISIS